MPNVAELLGPEDYPAWTTLDAGTQERLRNEAATVKMYLHRADAAIKDAQAYMKALALSNEDLGGIWCLFESEERTALKRRFK
jgi:hypothetical protein